MASPAMIAGALASAAGSPPKSSPQTDLDNLSKALIIETGLCAQSLLNMDGGNVHLSRI